MKAQPSSIILRNMNPNRNEALDLLRIVAALAVIIIHVSAWYTERPLLITADSIAIASFISALTFSGSRVFLLLSGYFIVGNNRYTNPKQVLKKFLHSLFLAGFWSALFSFVFILEQNGISLHVPSNIWNMVLHNLLHGTPYYHLWYLLLLPALYVLLPLISHIKTSLSSNKFAVIAWFILILGTTHLIWQMLHGGETWFPLRILDYLGFILVGATFSDEMPSKKPWSQIRNGVTVLALAVSGWLVSILSLSSNPLRIILANIVTMLYPIAMLFLFLGIRIQGSGLVSKIAKLGLGIYILHPLARSFLAWVTPKAFFTEIPIVFQLIIAIFCVFVLSALGTLVLRKNKFTRYFVTMV